MKFIFLLSLYFYLISSAYAANELWREGSSEADLKSDDIQSLITAAKEGDTILIEDGFYFEKLLFNNKKGTASSIIILKAKKGHKVIVSAAEEKWTIPNTAQWELAPVGFSSRNDIYRAVTPTVKPHRLTAYLSDGTRLYSYGTSSNDKASFIETDPNLSPGQGIYWEKDQGSSSGMGYVYLYLEAETDPNTQVIFIPIGTSSKDQALRFWGSEWITVSGIDFRHGGFSTVKLQGSNHIIFEDNKVFGGWAGVKVSKGSGGSVSGDNTIRRNQIHDNYSDNWWWTDRKRIDGTAIKVSEGGANNLISHNTISKYFNGIAVSASTEKNNNDVLHNHDVVIHNNYISDIMDDALELDGYVSSGNIYENLITDAFVGLSLTARWGDGPLYIHRNRFHTTKYVGQFDRDDVGPQSHNKPSSTKLGGGEDADNVNHPTENANLYNNTFFGTHYVVRSGFSSNGSSSSFPNLYPENFLWLNNIFYSINGVLAQATGEASKGVVFDSNLYWQENKDPLFMEYLFRNWDISFAEITNTRYYSLSSVIASISAPWESAQIEVAPDFFDANVNSINDTPMPGSPVIDAGMAVDSSWPNSVSVINSVDIGAMEITPTISLASTFPLKSHPAGGIPIIISGTGFDGNTQASINSNPLNDMVMISSTTIFGVVPASNDAATGLVSVTVSKNGVSSTLNNFEYTYDEQGDTDNDGISDVVDDDIDGDLILNIHETNTNVFVSADDTGTNPYIADTDGDGANDGIEILAGTNPVDNTSTPVLHDGDANNDGVVNVADLLIGLQILTGLKVASPLQLLKLDVAPLINGVSMPDEKYNLGDYLVITNKVVGLP